MLSVLGEPEEIISHTNSDPVPPEGLEYVEYRYPGFCCRTLYEPEMKQEEALIGQIEITASAAPGPRGICIGDTFASVLNCFPQEIDYTTDPYQRIYGKPTAEGAGGMAAEDVIIVTVDPLMFEPFMRIEFADGVVNRLFIGYRWI